jgi:GT2 family glycosyltransferase/MoaA/NifB/PqqE/SkfB family radical SAM enzyme
MEMRLFERIIGELTDPEIIRLNYSGESTHHPGIIKAIRLASATGATVEIVTALSSMPDRMVERIPESGLNRLTLSLHTLDPDQYHEIYGFGSVDALRRKVDVLLSARERSGLATPMLDIAFVAMNRNLAQLNQVAAYASQLGATGISIHPVIRRDPIVETFESELEDGVLRPDFLDRLGQAVDRVRDAHPDFPVAVSTPELGEATLLSHQPTAFPGKLPCGARIHSCEQNPWETIHILADGTVVTCEVRDRIPLGRISADDQGPSLKDIWAGPAYTAFRKSFQDGAAVECKTCPYKTAYLPARPSSSIDASMGAHAQLLLGWNPPDGSGLLWSKRSGVLELAKAGGEEMLHIEGYVPGEVGRVEVRANGVLLGQLGGDTQEGSWIDAEFNAANAGARILVELKANRSFVPARAGVGQDVRELGFGLKRIMLRQDMQVRRALSDRILRAIQLGASTDSPASATLSADWTGGVSVVIPERATPELLARALACLMAALDRTPAPSEIIVVVNGATMEGYVDLATKYPRVRWEHSEEPLGFTEAISRGLAVAQYGGVYLHNSDMEVEPDAIATLLPWRSPNVFAIASHIFFDDPAKRREETGWGDLRVEDGRFHLFDRTPEPHGEVRSGLYAGGGSSLFNAKLLRLFAADSHAYAPFYWEDVDWGLRAWRNGLQTLFHPGSVAWHRHRATVSKFYASEAIDRIVARNAFLFELRNRPEALDVRTRLEALDWASLKELATRPVCRELSRIRSSNRQAVFPNLQPDGRTNAIYTRPPAADGRPLVLVVSPFQVLPPRHGGARRTWHICEALSARWRFALLSDEITAYKTSSWKQPNPFESVHLVGGRPDGPTDRIGRIRSHSHPNLQRELDLAVHTLRPDLVQFEHIEVSGLKTPPGPRSLLVAHDVLISGEDIEADQDELKRLDAFDAVVVCCGEDAQLLPSRQVDIVRNGAMFGVPCEPSCRRSTLLFAGPFRYQPNLEGIRRFLGHVFPRLRDCLPDLELAVLGGDDAITIASGDPLFGQAGVRVANSVGNISTWLEQCALTINPLTGTRGSSVKLIESLAAGRVCVSTSDGARGFREATLSQLIVVDSVENMFEPILELMRDERLRLRLETIRPLELEPYSWTQSALAQERVYRRLLGCGA